MALDKKKFLTRAGSAIIFVVFMLACVLYNTWSFFFLFLLVQFLAMREFSFLLEEIYKVKFRRLSVFVALGAGTCIYTFLGLLPLKECTTTYSMLAVPQLFYFVGMAVGLIAFLLFISKDKKAKWLIAGIGYICIPLALLYHLRLQSLMIPLFLIFTIWINDTMAYLGGSFFGKRPLAVKISPNKTIEGTAIGILFAVGFAIAWGQFHPEYAQVHFIILAIIGSAIGTAGDLVESQLKRWAGVKDSGQILPGHGGALDRFDSLIFASSFAFIYAYFFMDCVIFKLF